MKKKIALLLTAAMSVSMLAGCGDNAGNSSAGNSDAETEKSSGTEEASDTNEESTGSDEAPAQTATGSVYYLNFKPEADQAWQDLAKTYTEKTGVEVKVVTAASGTYSETLTAEMSKSSAPTLFQCGNQSGLDTWKDYCLDLTGTDFYNEMTTDDFNLKGENGEVFCVGYCYEAFGIITNVKLLGDAGYTLDDIKDFASLKAVAEDITARSEELGFSAFTSAGLDGSSSWRFSGHLANMPLFYEFRDDNVTAQPAEITGAYLDNFKEIWDLYINNATCAPTELAAKTGDESEAEFGNGEAVFYQNGSWEYANLTGTFGMDPADLAMIPIYCGVAGEENSIRLLCVLERVGNLPRHLRHVGSVIERSRGKQAGALAL